MKGVHFVTDDAGKAIAVQLDLEEWGEIWEDMCDLRAARERENEPTIPWSEVKADLIRDGRNGGNVSDVRRFTAMIYRESDGYVALCPELDVASQGDTVEEASANLREAVELFLDNAAPSEIEGRMTGEMYVTALEVSAG